MASSSKSDDTPWYLKSTHPVLFPSHPAFTLPHQEFDDFLRNDLANIRIVEYEPEERVRQAPTETTESFAVVTPPSTSRFTNIFEHLDVSGHSDDSSEAGSQDSQDGQGGAPDMENMVRTDNNGLAHASTTNPLADLFVELEDVISGPRLRDHLQSAWAHDALATLKIIFNARSIHLGKGSRHVFYRCAGWLAQNHPLTLVANLRWLSRPIIPKKAQKKGTEDDFVLVEPVGDDDGDADPTRYDVRNGVAHGYWKDLLNILTLAVNGKLTVLDNPAAILNVDNTYIVARKARARGDADKARRLIHRRRAALNEEFDSGSGPRATRKPTDTPDITNRPTQWKEKRRHARKARHQAATAAFENDHLYRALHLTVARLFAEQLRRDLDALRSHDANARRNISLCAKWAPSHQKLHDMHTSVISSIAEVLYPRDPADADDRETYLRRARELYRRDVSSLRRHLAVVERDISAGTFSNIQYDRVPSIAMNRYIDTFMARDASRFEPYLDRVSEGKASISGATLSPSTLVKQVDAKFSRGPDEQDVLRSKIHNAKIKAADGQWRTLVQRVRDSGNLSSTLAVCDVSGSMYGPVFADGTRPVDSAVGLSLLVASVAQPPFAGSFVTFSDDPTVERVDLSAPLSEQVGAMSSASWGYSTDLVAVFERLILPAAVEARLPREDMVRRVIVFSDMQFNRSGTTAADWSTSYGRIRRAYAEAGYDVPELVFWNLAGGRGGGAAPLPVTMADTGTSLVSGYSQGMLKVFLDDGDFGGPAVAEEGSQSAATAVDPLAVVTKAIGHKGYDVLRVLD